MAGLSLRAGATFQKGPDHEPYVVEDGNLLTGQNSASATPLAQACIRRVPPKLPEAAAGAAAAASGGMAASSSSLPAEDAADAAAASAKSVVEAFLAKNPELAAKMDASMLAGLQALGQDFGLPARE